MADGADFSVNSSYVQMSELCNEGLGLEETLKRELVVLWKTKAQSKMLSFCWRIIHNSLPCRVELNKREVIIGRHNTCCPICFDGDEDLDHLFLSCSSTSLFWKKLSFWLGMNLDSHVRSLLLHFYKLKQSLKLKFHVDFYWCLSFFFWTI